MTKIHEQAIVDPKAKLAVDVSVGPFSVIGPDVELGPGCVVGSHVVLKGPAKVGANNKFFQFCSIGEDPQDLKYKGEATLLEIGDNNTFRESVTVHRGTVQDKSLTKIGNNNLFITYSHVAHDCVIGNETVIGHHVGLGGHVHVEDYAILGSYAAVHQYCKVGAYSFLGHLVMLVMDLPPFMLAAGTDSPRTASINSEGLKRRGFDSEKINLIRKAYKILYREGLLLEDAKAKLRDLAKDCQEIKLLLDFIENSNRGILR